MRLLFLIISLLAFSSCGLNSSDPEHKANEKQKLANALRRKVVTSIQQKTGLTPFGTGAGMLDQIWMLALSFSFYEEIDIKRGRNLLLTAMNEFLETVNSDERIRPYLKNYPFEAKNIEIRIFLYGEDRRNVAPGKLSVVSALEGVFIYNIDNPETKLFTIIHQESYEEALLRVHEALKKSG